MEDCIFCKIVQKKVDAKVVYEDKEILAFNDIHPIAPVHILIISKEHIASINDMIDDKVVLVGNMVLAAKNLAKELGIAENGYKLLFRTGKHGGQEVNHVHLHLIGGAALHEDIRPLEVNWKQSS